MAGTITGANATYLLSIPPIFPLPQQLQGFAADDVFDTDPVEASEVLMGVDGIMSAGFVFVPVKQNISIQADSDSATLFDNWYLAQQTIKDVYYAYGIVNLNTIGKKWILNKGSLTTYPPIPNVKKLLQPRKFTITWQSATPVSV